MTTAASSSRLVAVAVLFWAGTASAGGLDKDICSPETQKHIYGELFSSDQKLRGNYRTQAAMTDQVGLDRIRDEIIEQDQKNQDALDDIVGKCGWPDAGTFVNGNLEAAFYVIQHAPLAYMERYKARIEHSHAEGKIPDRNMELFYQRLEFRKAERARAVPHN